MPDLLERIRSELDHRIAALKPAADEFARLKRAADALDRLDSPDAAAPQAAPARRGRPSVATVPPSARAKPARQQGSSSGRPARAAPGQTQLRVIEQLRSSPGSSSTAVAHALGISANAAAATISRLVKQGRVTRLDAGGYGADAPAAPAPAPAPGPVDV